VSAVAVGEIGLDYHYDFSPRAVQQAVFEAQVELAVARGLPVIIHTREATDDTMAVLQRARGVTGVMHCFTGTLDEARRALDLGFHISLSGIVTFPRADALRDVARFVPEDRLLVETDAPFLAPVPHRGRRNEPAWVVETVKAVAATRRVAATDLAVTVVRNFQMLAPSRSLR
jgi:TatD DNase family protein